MGKDLEVDELKVKKDAEFKDDVDIDGHLHVHGSLDFGRKSVQQSGTNTSAVTINTSSGIIVSFTAAAADHCGILMSAVVYNKRVKVSSTVLATIESGVVGLDTGALPYPVISNILNDQFTLTVYNIGPQTTNATGTIQIGYLVC